MNIFFNSKKVSDHHAVILIMELEKTELSILPESERNILFLGSGRFRRPRTACSYGRADGIEGVYEKRQKTAWKIG